MNTYYFKHEILRMFKQRKKFLVVAFVMLIMLLYIVFIMPTQQSIYTFDDEQASEELKDLEYMLKGMEEREGTGFSPMAGIPVYAVNEGRYETERSLIYAYQDNTPNRFLRLSLMNLQSIRNKVRPLKEDSPYPVKDIEHEVTKTSMMYESFLKDGLPVSNAMIEQKTALQSMYHFLLSAGVFLLMFLMIYFSCDILVKDRHNKTILQGLPISWYRIINVKSLVAISYTLFAILIIAAVGLLVIGIQNGFGSFSFKIPTIFGEYDPQRENYDMMKMGKFFLLCLVFLVLLCILFTRLNMIFSLIFKNTWVVLMISAFILFAEQIYLSRTSRELFDIDIGYFPQTYFNFSNVITGERMFLLNTDSITYGKGLIIIGISIFVVEIVLFVFSKMIGKRRFYKV